MEQGKRANENPLQAENARLLAEVQRLKREQKAAEERASEVGKANQALKHSVSQIATMQDVRLSVETIFRSIIEETSAVSGAIFHYDTDADTVQIRVNILHGELIDTQRDPRMELWRRPFEFREFVQGCRAVLIAPEGFFVAETLEETYMLPGVRKWHLAMGHQGGAVFPLLRGEEPIGFIGLALAEPFALKSEKIELVRALTQQLTLAIEMTRLADEEKQFAVARERQAVAEERAAELAKSNAALQSEIIERRRAEQVSRGQTEAMAQALNVLAEEPTLDAFLGHVLTAIAAQLRVPMCALYLHDTVFDTISLKITYHEGRIRQGAEQFPDPYAGRPLPADTDAFWKALVETRSPIIIPDIEQNTQSQRYQWLLELGIRTVLLVPLLLGGKVIGLLGVRSKGLRDYAPQEIELAQALAHQITLAINTTRLAEQGRQNAVLEERNRMAREIHDTLAQGFTGVVMQIGAATRYLNDDPETALAHLGNARNLATEALAEARRSVQALRPKMLEAGSLALALQETVAQMQTEQTVALTCRIEGLAFALPEEWERNALRIGQEALTNALRHAEATRITVTLAYAPDYLRLVVTDDGKGFDQEARADGYGILGMRERNRQMQAQLYFETAPGMGTRLTLHIDKPAV